MGYYVGLDVSLKSTHICVLDGERRVVWRGVSDTQIAMIAEHLARWGEQIVLVGLETGSLTPWLYHGLSDLGLPMVCMDARRASDALKARAEKTDKADARALAEMLASGWYSAVHVKSLESQRQAFDIDEGMHFAALHLLAGVVTHCVFFTPARGSPFSAAFSDWLSRIAAVGLASRPSVSRSAMWSSSQMRSQTPSRWNWRKML